MPTNARTASPSFPSACSAPDGPGGGSTVATSPQTESRCAQLDRERRGHRRDRQLATSGTRPETLAGTPPSLTKGSRAVVAGLLRQRAWVDPDLHHQPSSLARGGAVHELVVGVPRERAGPIPLCRPAVERMVHEQVRQHGRDRVQASTETPSTSITSRADVATLSAATTGPGRWPPWSGPCAHVPARIAGRSATPITRCSSCPRDRPETDRTAAYLTASKSTTKTIVSLGPTACGLPAAAGLPEEP